MLKCRQKIYVLILKLTIIIIINLYMVPDTIITTKYLL